MAGWNIETGEMFGALLGPEETPRLGVVFSGGHSRPGPSNASLCDSRVFSGVVGVVVVVVGGGVVVC